MPRRARDQSDKISENRDKYICELPTDTLDGIFRFFVQGMNCHVHTTVLREVYTNANALASVQVVFPCTCNVVSVMAVCALWRRLLAPRFREYMNQIDDVMRFRCQAVPVGVGQYARIRVAHYFVDADEFTFTGSQTPMVLHVAWLGPKDDHENYAFQPFHRLLETFARADACNVHTSPSVVYAEYQRDYALLASAPTPAMWGSGCNAMPSVRYVDVRSVRGQNFGDPYTGDAEIVNGVIMRHTAEAHRTALARELQGSFEAQSIARCDASALSESAISWVRVLCYDPECFLGEVMRLALQLNHATTTNNTETFSDWMARSCVAWKCNADVTFGAILY